MPPISLRPLIAQATRGRGGGRSVVSRRNFSSSSISNDEPKLPRISIGWVVFGATSAAAGYGTVDEMELRAERQKVETNKQEALK
ncbi:unnamed protein product [Arabidopsis halleri]